MARRVVVILRGTPSRRYAAFVSTNHARPDCPSEDGSVLLATLRPLGVRTLGTHCAETNASMPTLPT